MGSGGDLAGEQVPQERAESRGRHEEQGLDAGPQVAGRAGVEEDLRADGETGDAGAVQQGPGHGDPEPQHTIWRAA